MMIWHFHLILFSTIFRVIKTSILIIIRIYRMIWIITNVIVWSIRFTIESVLSICLLIFFLWGISINTWIRLTSIKPVLPWSLFKILLCISHIRSIRVLIKIISASLSIYTSSHDQLIKFLTLFIIYLVLSIIIKLVFFY